MSSDEIKSQLPCFRSSYCINSAQLEDVRRAAQAILNTMLGITGERTVIDEKWGETAHLLPSSKNG